MESCMQPRTICDGPGKPAGRPSKGDEQRVVDIFWSGVHQPARPFTRLSSLLIDVLQDCWLDSQ